MRRLLIALLGIAALGAAALTVSACGESTASAQSVVDESSRNFAEVKSYHTDFDVRIGLEGDKTDATGIDPQLAAALPLELKVTGKMDMDARDPDNVKFRAYELGIEGLDKLAQSSGSSEGSSSAEDALAAGMMQQALSGMEVSFIKDTLYLKMMNTWFEMPLNDMSGSGDIDMQCLLGQAAEPGAASSMIPSQSLESLEELPAETIDGTKTRHFKAAVDGEKMMAEMEKSSEKLKQCGFDESDLGAGTSTTGSSTTGTGTTGSSTTGTGSSTTTTGTTTGSSTTGTTTGAGDSEASKKAIKSVFDNMVYELWVDEDNNLRQVKVVMEMNMGDFSGLAGSSPLGDQIVSSLIMKLDMTAKLSGFGQDVEITKPENAMPFEDLLGGSLGGSLGDSLSTTA